MFLVVREHLGLPQKLTEERHQRFLGCVTRTWINNREQMDYILLHHVLIVPSESMVIIPVQRSLSRQYHRAQEAICSTHKQALPTCL